MDESGFAQSRGDDDLFDDEIIPIEPSQVETVTQKLQETSVTDNAPKGPSAPSSFRGNRGATRGNYTRGSGRGGRGRGGDERLQTSQPAAAPAPAESEPTEKAATDAGSESQAEGPKPDAPTEPARPAAVRGDRTATGGVKKPKLTEAELTTKMAEAKTRATAVAEAHARAQADAASFEERERVAQVKRRVDVANRKVMDTEREANRRRKMQAQGGREWDMEKNEEEFAQRGRGRGSGFMRGAHGGVRYDRAEEQNTGSDSLDDQVPYEGRGRGGRGRGGGGGRDRGRGSTRGDSTRGGTKGGLTASKYAQPDLKAETEYPSLPPTANKPNPDDHPPPPTQDNTKPESKPDASRPPRTGRKDSDMLRGIGGSGEDRGTWADQMERSEVAK